MSKPKQKKKEKEELAKARRKTARIAAKTNKYLDAMMAAGANGGQIEDYMDSKGVDAMRKVVALAKSPQYIAPNKGPQDFEPGSMTDAASSPKNAGMPIPTVTEIDDSGKQAGYDLFSLLLKQRIVLLQGEVDESMAAIACASLLYLDSSASGRPGEKITVEINSPGGSVLAGMAIYDMIRYVDSPVRTVGIGMQASMGSILLASGDERAMTPNAKLMIHGLGSRNEGKISDMDISSDFSTRLFEELKNVYVRHIGLTHEFWDYALERDTWLTADQALKMGFIQEIERNPKKTTAYEKESIREEFQKARDAKIPKTADAVIKMLNNVSAREGEAGSIRPELVTALSQFPEFWTKAKQQEMKAAGKVSSVANDNQGKSAPVRKAAKKSSGPS